MTNAPTLTTRALNRATLARQMLLAREKMTTIGGVERLVGLQAQLPRPPFVGLWTRLVGFRRDELIDLLRRREIVRATAMRGTLHLMTAGDYAALRGALQPALTRGMHSVLRDRAKALDHDPLDRTARAFFRDGPATFERLRAHLRKRHPGSDERALAYAVRLQCPLVQVPADTRWGFPASADFALADDWLKRKVSTKEVSAGPFVRRYLAAFGPATPGDAEVWSGLAGLRAVFEKMRPTLVTFRDARNRELFDLPDAPRPSEDTPAPVRFLPEFDNLVLSYDDRTRVLATEHRPRIVLKNLQVLATFLVDGVVAGTWTIERKKNTAVLSVEPFSTLERKTMAALEQEGDALLHFVEEDAEFCEVRCSRTPREAVR